MKLPSLSTQVKDIETAQLDGGICTWTESTGAGSYEVKFMRNGTTLGGNQIVNGLTYDGTRYMTKGASYHFMVRPINAKDPTIKGHWTDSNLVTISDDQAKKQKEANAAEQSAGTWSQENGFWKFTAQDGTVVKNCWRQISDLWYAFDEAGRMRTGWFMDGGKWYYFDPANGFMWKNTVTPDGYTLGIDGVMSGSAQYASSSNAASQ